VKGEEFRVRVRVRAKVRIRTHRTKGKFMDETRHKARQENDKT
jgi:hypothetical protein